MTWVCGTLKKLDKGRRAGVVAPVGEVIARSGSGLRLLPHLLGDDVEYAGKSIVRRLALEVAAHLSQAPAAELLQRLKPYLASKVMPAETRQDAVAGLLRVLGAQPGAMEEVLEAYVSATSKVRAVERLQALEAQVGKMPVLDAVVSAIEERVRMTCPRCAAQLERREMVKHLWDDHRLLLEGRRVRAALARLGRLGRGLPARER